MKYMFVDDNRSLLASIELVLRSNNVVIAECHSASEAVRAIQKEAPDVLFLDDALTQGGHEGLEVMDWIDRSIRVYATTGNTSSALRAEYARRGAEFVSKTDLKAIIAIINAKKEVGSDQ